MDITQKMWSPYLVGALIGVLSWCTFFFSNKAIGCSTQFSRFSGIIDSLFNKEEAKKREYYQGMSLSFDWDFAFVIGILIGAIISASLSGSFELTLVPSMWADKFGDTHWVRFAASIVGGFLLGFGSRFSGGCTSGHGISGTMQLALSSWLVVPFFFLGGIIMAILLYRVF